MLRGYWFFIVPVVLIFIVLLLLIPRPSPTPECFTDIDEFLKLKIPSDMPAPPELFKKVRGFIDKYDTPELWNHVTKVHTMDPGELARMQLGIVNSDTTIG